MTAYTDFLSDPNRTNVWLAEMQGRKKTDGSIETFRFALAGEGGYATEPTDTPANTPYRARLLGGYNFRAKAAPPGTLGVLPLREGGQLEIAHKLGDLDATFEEYDFDGRPIVIRHGGRSRFGRLAHADFAVVFNGLVGQALNGLDRVTVTLRERADYLSGLLEDRVFPGSTYCLELDGSSGSVSHGSPAKLDLTGSVTLEAWVVRYATGAAQGLGGWGGGTAFPFNLRVTSGNVLRLASSAGTIASSTSTLATSGIWFHVAAVVDSAGATFYIYNAATGVESVDFVAGSFLSRPAISGSPTFYLGLYAAGPSYLQGLLREVRVWGVARTAEEIRSARFRKLTAVERTDTNLKLYARLNEGTGTACADDSPSPANGTTSGTVAWRPSLGGGDELEGATLPNAFGPVEMCEPILVDPFRWIYQVHSRKANAISAVYNGASPVTLDTAYTSLATFLATTPGAGKYSTLLFDGGSYFRLGSAPDAGSNGPRPVTCKLQGDASGAGYVSTAADVIRRVVTSFGEPATRLADPADLDTASFSALNTANSAPLQLWAPDKMTRAQAIDHFLATVGAVAKFNRADGKLHLQRIEAVSGTPVLVLSEADIRGGLRPVLVSDPFAAIRMLYRRCYRPHSVGELAQGQLSTAVGSFAQREWREVTRTSAETRVRFPLAGELEIESAFTAEADAVAEADRRLLLVKSRGRAFELECRSRAFQLDRFDLVQVTYRDENARGQLQYRLGTATTNRFLVLGVEEDTARGAVKLTIWRHD